MDGPSAHPRLRLGDVAVMPTAELIPLFERSFTALVTVAIAEATMRVPSSTRRLLRRREWHLDWLDALKYAEGELQVSVERMLCTGDPRAARNEYRLRRVRSTLTAAHRVAADFRRRAHHGGLLRSPMRDACHTARNWLSKLHMDEFAKLLAEERAAHGLAPLEEPAVKDVYDSIELAYRRGWIEAPLTPGVNGLLTAPARTVRDAAADDARRQEGREPALFHPLLLRRWDQALRELAKMTFPLAGAGSPCALGPLPSSAAALPHGELFRLLNARRFMAAVLQRRVECGHRTRHVAAAAGRAGREDPRCVADTEARDRAGRRLAELYSEEYAWIRAQLAPYEYRPGLLDRELLDVEARAAVKRRVTEALADGSWRTR
ncbi:hypothetical protein [Streptomyces luteireticuli]|uniref:CHAD domain-containing protein n=1 Tax=Streptomyces luteireticuli TaxID=173858 RepID=A0ABP3I8E6_9ACTN